MRDESLMTRSSDRVSGLTSSAAWASIPRRLSAYTRASARVPARLGKSHPPIVSTELMTGVRARRILRRGRVPGSAAPVGSVASMLPCEECVALGLPARVHVLDAGPLIFEGATIRSRAGGLQTSVSSHSSFCLLSLFLARADVQLSEREHVGGQGA